MISPEAMEKFKDDMKLLEKIGNKNCMLVFRGPAKSLVMEREWKNMRKLLKPVIKRLRKKKLLRVEVRENRGLGFEASLMLSRDHTSSFE